MGCLARGAGRLLAARELGRPTKFCPDPPCPLLILCQPLSLFYLHQSWSCDDSVWWCQHCYNVTNMDHSSVSSSEKPNSPKNHQDSCHIKISSLQRPDHAFGQLSDGIGVSESLIFTPIELYCDTETNWVMLDHVTETPKIDRPVRRIKILVLWQLTARPWFLSSKIGLAHTPPTSFMTSIALQHLNISFQILCKFCYLIVICWMFHITTMILWWQSSSLSTMKTNKWFNSQE
jgi:hypothetical protein